MDKEMQKTLRELDFQGVEFLVCRNTEKLVETDMTYFRLKDFGESANEAFRNIFRE